MTNRLIASRLTQFLDKALTDTLGNPSVLHGDAKERRKVVLHHGESKPEATDAITLWVRDGFSAPEASVLADIRKLSTDDPTLHLFLPESPRRRTQERHCIRPGLGRNAALQRQPHFARGQGMPSVHGDEAKRRRPAR